MDNVLIKIGSAVQEVSRLTKQGQDLRAALVKVAVDQELTQEQVKRVVETINTHNTLSHFRNGEKMAEFPVADSRDIVSEAFHTKAAEYDPAFPTPDEYLLADRHQFVPHEDRVMMKAAEAILDATPPPARYAQDPEMLVQEAMMQIGVLEKRAQDLHVRAEGAKQDLFEAINGLAHSFQVYGADPLEIFVKEAQHFYGPKADEYLPVVWKMVPEKFKSNPYHTKQASVPDATTPSHLLLRKVFILEDQFVKAAQEAEALAVEAHSWREKLASLFGAGSSHAKTAAKGDDPAGYTKSKRRGGVLIPTSAKSAPKPPAKRRSRGSYAAKGSAPAPAPAEKEKKKGILSGILGRGKKGGGETTQKGGEDNKKSRGKKDGVNLPKKTPGKRFIPSAAGSATDLLSALPAVGALGGATSWIGNMDPLVEAPEAYGHWEQLGDNLRMQETIQQVLSQDPILRERSSEEMLPIIQTVVRVAPQLAMHPPVLSAILREATTGPNAAIDPMSLMQMADAQSKLMNNQLLRQQQITG